jgi:hypothetical protein
MMEGIQEGFDHPLQNFMGIWLIHTASETDINILIASYFGIPIGIRS